MLEEFPHLTSRLNFIEFYSDPLRNFEVWICLTEFESYVYGVVSQYGRISQGLPKHPFSDTSSFWSTQLSLHIYFYMLAWDKLKKVFGKLKQSINALSKSSDVPLPTGFLSDFRSLRSRMDHLLDEFNIAARNEYEHPSLQPSKIGNLVQFKNVFQDHQGDIKAHIGKDEYAVVRMVHVEKLKSLWVDLVDLFVKYFSKKTPTSDLLELKKQIEENSDTIITEYRQLREEGKNVDANHILHQVLMSDLYLSIEGIPLRQDVREKLYTGLLQRDAAR
jgi:hypothetical protein